MAERRCSFEETGNPIVMHYEFDEKIMDNGTLNVKIFDGVSEEWAEFILQNRMARGMVMSTNNWYSRVPNLIKQKKQNG